ncbi:MAG: tRNA uridine-5-carboxymethylaminomethyl(34) synthesis GTPase MnmE [Bradymonadales bacterium]|jgi:tRNA modification GTPase
MIIDNDTIVAIATGNAPGAIGILRISGADSLDILKRCHQATKALEPRQMTLRKLYDPENGELLDQVMLCYFPAPHSYTGEDVVELYAHGGRLNLARILDALCGAGARLAQPGEYTQRAFLNRKLDLSQAEAIMDIIGAQTQRALREAQKQLSGSVSKPVQDLRQQLLKIIITLESCIDFSEQEELLSLPREELRADFHKIIAQIQAMLRASESLRLDGYRVALLGKPNAGKSSLFNMMLGQDRAIVTDISGTTTDTIQERVKLGGIDICLIDTAGIGDADNLIEQLGVERSLKEAERADIILWICDINDNFTLPPESVCRNLDAYIEENAFFLILNKIDLQSSHTTTESAFGLLQERFPKLDRGQIFELSTVTGAGMVYFEEKLARHLRTREEENEGLALVTSQRHITLLRNSLIALTRALEALQDGLPAECIAADVRDALDALGQIVGSIAADDVLNAIFSQFCIGK